MNPNDVVTVAPGALQFLAATVDRVEEGEWARPSILDDWSVRDVVAHVTGSVAKMSALIEDTPPPSQRSEPSDWYREDQRSELRSQIDRALALLPTAPLAEPRRSPAGTAPLAVALGFPTVDAIVHAWDIDRSCGRRLEVPEDLLAFATALTDRLGEVAENNPNFAPPAPCPRDASPTERLMARLGRAVG